MGEPPPFVRVKYNGQAHRFELAPGETVHERLCAAFGAPSLSLFERRRVRDAPPVRQWCVSPCDLDRPSDGTSMMGHLSSLSPCWRLCVKAMRHSVSPPTTFCTYFARHCAGADEAAVLRQELLLRAPRDGDRPARRALRMTVTSSWFRDQIL